MLDLLSEVLASVVFSVLLLLLQAAISKTDKKRMVIFFITVQVKFKTLNKYNVLIHIFSPKK